MKTTFTKKDMMQRKGCYSMQRVVDLFFTDNTEITIETILTSSIPIKDKRWFVYNSCDLTLDEEKKLSLLLSWAVLPIFETKNPNDNRVRECLEGIEKFIKGEITKEELLILKRAAAYAADTAADAYADAADNAADNATATAAYAAYNAVATAEAAAADAYVAAAYAAYAAAEANDDAENAAYDAYAAVEAADDAKLTYTQKLNSIVLEFVK